MSTSAPWNFQPSSESQGSVKLFNPAQFQQNGPVQPSGTDHTNQSSWGSGWGADNQYGNYNTAGDANAGAQQVSQDHGQNVQDEGQNYQGQGDSQQFYNLNPGIQQGYNQAYQQVNQGQPIQYDEKGQPIQQFDQLGQPIQYNQSGQTVQYDMNGQPIQFDQNGQPIQQYGEQQQQYDQQSQQYYNYDNQGQVYDHNYGWNNPGWNGYGSQQNWSTAENQGAETPNETGNSENVMDSVHDNSSAGVQIQESPTTEGGNIEYQHSDNTGHDNLLGDNVLNTSGEGYDHFNRDEPEITGNHNQNLNVPMSESVSGDISSESLVTLNSSSNQLVNSESEGQNIANQMENLNLGDKSKEKTNSEKGDTNHSAVDGQGVSVDSGPKQSKDSPVSQNSQTSDEWEMVPPPNTLMPPSNHSRQGSTDSSSNVHFFIGSTNISPSGTPPVHTESNTGDKKPEESSPTSNMIPKHASSPMPPRSDGPPATSGPPPGIGVPPPPTGMGQSGGNPFRKGKGSEVKTGHPAMSNVSQNDESSPSANLKLDTAVATGYPSPIQPVAEEASSADSQSQSPIMPRKESPFQPPRRRNLSQSSNSFDDENTPMHSDKGHMGDDLRRDSGLDRRGTDRKMGPMKADRSIVPTSSSRHQDSGIDYNRFSNRGKEERRPRSPLNSGRTVGGGRTTPTKPPTGRTTPTKASGRTTPGRITPSRRLEQAAYQKAVERRKKENISPATSLWANNDEVPKANILLAPAAPVQGSSGSAIMPILGLLPQTTQKTNPETNEVLSPVENLISSISNNLSRENSPEKDLGKSKVPDRGGPRRDTRDTTQKDRHERNSSIDREIEMTKRMDERERVRESERSYKDDRTRGPRDDRYRDDRYRDNRDYRDRERDMEREKYYEAYYQRNNKQSQRDPYYVDERYERPRSRQSTVDDRAPSRQTEASDRGRYDRDQYYRDRYGRGYYDYYGNNRQQYGYYDPRYQEYYDSRYGKGYYDEYYSGQYSDNYDRMSRYDYSWQQAGYYDHYRNDDSYSTRSDSRVHTPGSLSDSGDQLEGYQRSRASSRQGYDDYHRGHYDPYYSYGYGDYYNNSYMEPEPPGRMTPEKYTLPHMCARFGPGGHLIKVMPNRPKEGQTATVEIHDISMMLEDRPEVEELKCFPGPLVRNDTHKNDVLSFCQQKAKACSENIDMTDRESAELIWRLLEVLIKQNGVIVGTDIADLLLQGHEPTTAEYSIMGMKISSSTDNLEADLDDSEISNITMDRSVVNKSHRSREEVTDRFRHLLMYGRKKDALEWAMKNNLWGHALFLASKMDSKAHANVMTRFANSAMKMNDPLQTLYQLMSGRQPAAVSCITDEKWGDWRPHLAMMLSNQTHKHDLDRKCIMTMGDTLAARGFLHASHFCYLMAQAGFGSYHKKTSKMVLIGSSHTLPLSEFATNEAIQCSEVYEYAMSLGNAAYFSPNLQYFKYLYACRMAENGFAQQALEYCEVIAKFINVSPTVFQPALVKLVFELASRLKKFDPEKQQVGEDSDDPMWLQHLQRVNQGFEDGSIQPLSGSVTPYCFMGTRSSSASGEVAGLTDFGAVMQSGQYTGSSPYQQNQQIYQQGYDQSQMYNQAYQAYNQGQVQTEAQQPDAQTENQGYTGDQSQQYQSNQQTTTDQGQGQDYSSQGYYQGQMYQGQQVEQQQNQQYTGQEGQQYQYQHHDLATVPESTMAGSQDYSQQSHTEDNSQQQQPNMTQPTDFSMYHNHSGLHNQPGQRNSISSVGTVSSHADTDDEESLGNSQRSEFDYFGAATKQQIVAPKLRKRTESESSQAGPQKSDSMPQQKTEMKQDLSDKKQQSQSKGWFGGVFSKLIPKSKNEMKLPDDKDPSIVWDPVKKKWVNQDGSAEDDKPTAPPPKDMELSSSTAPQLTPSTGTPAVGPPMGNRFGRPRGRGARTQYVDVLNPKSSESTASVPNNIFNVMPSSQSSPAIFNPSGGGESEPSQPETNVAQPTDQRVPSREGEPAEMPPPSGPPSMPMLFNPSQVSQTSTAPQTGSKRLNQRRIYPKS